MATPPPIPPLPTATPPGATETAQPRPYTGPPSYPAPPRWGFLSVGWRSATSTAPELSAEERMRALAATAVPLLWLTAAVVLVTAGAEGWRYALLLDSRTDAVPAWPLHVSDALVITGGVISLLTATLAGLVTVGWLLHACATAAQAAGVRPPRPSWQVVAGVLVPGVNLLLPGAVLAELEHAALHRDPDRRPRPSPLVTTWWVLWASGLMLAGVTMLWGLRDGVQARADGVLLHLATDLVAGVVAGTTVVVVRRLTRLLSPTTLRGARRMVVVRIGSGSTPGG
ncbi:MAG TPA: DUF4328 domain-containing protein [Pseudonocardiaceae bacterium]|nr:DUF4328 domain-containing protein [Pseudonocardiaceae bacterium]